jgi:hypothetical protein
MDFSQVSGSCLWFPALLKCSNSTINQWQQVSPPARVLMRRVAENVIIIFAELVAAHVMRAALWVAAAAPAAADQDRSARSCMQPETAVASTKMTSPVLCLYQQDQPTPAANST